MSVYQGTQKVSNIKVYSDISGIIPDETIPNGEYGLENAIEIEGDNNIGIKLFTNEKTQSRFYEVGSTVEMHTTNEQITNYANITPEKIKSGEIILGVEGNYSGEGIDTSDATATAADILLNKTAYVNNEKLIGTIPLKNSQEYVPTTISQTINAQQYLNGVQIILGDEDLIPENIKYGVEIFGVTGTHQGSITPAAGYILDTSTFSSADQTLSSYGDLIYISESSNEENTLLSLSDVVEKWGGTTVTNNYIGNSDQKYGIKMSNWSESDVTTGILFNTPIELNAGRVLFSLNMYISSWMNAAMQFNLIKAVGDSSEEILADLTSKISTSSFDYTYDFAYPGVSSLTDVIKGFDLSTSGTYYLYISGFTKGDNSESTLITLRYLNY